MSIKLLVAGLLILLMAGQGMATVDDYVDRYKLDNSTGTLAIDMNTTSAISGTLINMNTGLDNGTSGWSSSGCVLNNCLAFAGTQYVKFSPNLYVSKTKSFTVSGHFRFSNTDTAQTFYANVNNDNDRFGIRVSAKRAYAGIYNGTGYQNTKSSDSNLTNNTLYYWAYSFNYSTNISYLYINNVSQAGVVSDNSIGGTANETIGSKTDGTGGVTGTIDDVRIYPRDLSNSEINISGNLDPTTPDTWKYWTYQTDESCVPFLNNGSIMELLMLGSQCTLGSYLGGHLEKKVANVSKYGTYSIDMKTSIPLNSSYGIDNAFYVYNSSTTAEIDYEFLTAEPKRIRLTVWKSQGGSVATNYYTSRIINMTTGIVDYSVRCWGSPCVTNSLLPTSISPIIDYNHSARYYNYTFEWTANSVTFYMKNGTSGDNIYLWNFTNVSDIPNDNVWTTLATTYIDDYGTSYERPITDVTAYFTNYSYIYENGIYTRVSNNISNSGLITQNESINWSIDNILNASITPSASSITVNVTTWNTTGDYYKKLNLTGNATITAGDNPRNAKMQIKLNGTNYATVQVNSTGYFRWVYSGGAGESQLEFEFIKVQLNPFTAVEVAAMATAATIALYTIYRRRGRGGRIYGLIPFL